MKKQDDTELREAILDLRKPDKLTAKRPIEAELDDLINLFTTRLASIQKADDGGLAHPATPTAQSNQFVTRSELAANEKVGWFTVGDRVYQRIDISKGTQRFVGILEPGSDLAAPKPLATTDTANPPKSGAAITKKGTR